MARPARGSIEIIDRKDGLRTYWMRITVDGRRQRVRLGTDRDGWTPARAQVELEEQTTAVQAGTWTAPQPPAAGDAGDPTFRAYASSWLEDNMLEWRPRTIKDIRWRLESHLLPQIGGDRLSTFDIPRVTAVKTALLKDGRRIAARIEAGVIERDAHNMPLKPLSNETINKCLALLSRILDDAVERGYLRDNPARRVKRLRYHRPRRPILEPHEVRAMLEAADRIDCRAAGLTDKALQVAELRAQGLTYTEIAKRLSIAISTACYRHSRYERARDPVPFARVWIRLLCAAGCESTRPAACVAATSTSSPSRPLNGAACSPRRNELLSVVNERKDCERAGAGERDRPAPAVGVVTPLGQSAQRRQPALAVGTGDLDGAAANDRAPDAGASEACVRVLGHSALRRLATMLIAPPAAG